MKKLQKLKAHLENQIFGKICLTKEKTKKNK